MGVWESYFRREETHNGSNLVSLFPDQLFFEDLLEMQIAGFTDCSKAESEIDFFMGTKFMCWE